MQDKEMKSMCQIMIFDSSKQKILLGKKKRGLGVGGWDGFGGKLEKGETMDECVIRETKEECGLSLVTFSKVGHMTFNFTDKPFYFDIHVYSSNKYEGTITESEEMFPKWFDIKDIPFSKMWPTDPLWYPYLLNEKKFKAVFLYEGYDKMIEYSLGDWVE